MRNISGRTLSALLSSHQNFSESIRSNYLLLPCRRIPLTLPISPSLGHFTYGVATRHLASGSIAARQRSVALGASADINRFGLRSQALGKIGCNLIGRESRTYRSNHRSQCQPLHPTKQPIAIEKVNDGGLNSIYIPPCECRYRNDEIATVMEGDRQNSGTLHIHVFKLRLRPFIHPISIARPLSGATPVVPINSLSRLGRVPRHRRCAWRGGAPVARWCRPLCLHGLATHGQRLGGRLGCVR